jgi:hypothetical protein
MQLKSFLQSQLDHVYFSKFAKCLSNVINDSQEINIKMKCSDHSLTLINLDNEKHIEFITKNKTYSIESENVFCYSDIFNQEQEFIDKFFLKLYQDFVN